MIPIEKNIAVTDEQGNIYEATYPKRAKGLVKNGRARFVGENKICLACPPIKILEDNLMEKTNIENTTIALAEKPLELNIDYVLSQIAKIISDNVHIHEAINIIKEMEVNNSLNGGFGDQAKGEALGSIVTARETTNQQLIHLLEKMYEDLKPQKDSQISKFNELKESLKGTNFVENEFSPQALEMLKHRIQIMNL